MSLHRKQNTQVKGFQGGKTGSGYALATNNTGYIVSRILRDMKTGGTPCTGPLLLHGILSTECLHQG